MKMIIALLAPYGSYMRKASPRRRYSTVWVILGGFSWRVHIHVRHAISNVVRAFSFFRGGMYANILGISCTVCT